MEDTKIKLFLSKKFIFDDRIKGVMYDLMFNLYYKLLKNNKDVYKFLENIIYIYPYFFSNEHIFLNFKNNILDNFKFVKYNVMLSYYRLNEIFKFYN
jgi:chemotaxis methyl-accepting protein methylase